MNRPVISLTENGPDGEFESLYHDKALIWPGQLV
jgi:hypothetical protein